MKRNRVIFYDCGHGGEDPITKEYVTAPDKMFKHKDFTFYEGVKNRIVGKAAIAEMTKRGITVVPVSHEWEDTPLWKRVYIANQYDRYIQEGIYMSEHSDAFRTNKAKGFAIWTSPGQTQSDVIADMGYKMYQHRFSKEVIRKQLSDGDPDYEARFKVLVDTNMPAILFENLYFTNEEDVKKLMDPIYIKEYAKFQADLAEWAITQ